jgi:hypothetical protein
MTLSQDNDTPMGGTSLSTSLGDYFARYRMALYLVFATTVSLSIAWNFPSATAVSLGTEIA